MEAQEAKNVGIWIRVSTDLPGQAESPENHLKRAELYAQAKGWSVETVYNLTAVSGKTVKGHPEAQRMMRDVKSGKIQGLIFSKLARLARNTVELLEFADLFREHEADLISLQESIDTSTPAGRMFYGMIASLSQWEREEISSRIKASIPIRAKQGKPIGGEPPYGYRRVNKKIVLDPEEAPIRKLMFELFLELQRKKSVAVELNKRGYRTRRGAEFSDSAVARYLTDPISKGQMRTNYTTMAKNGKTVVLKPEEEWVIIEVPAVVSEELYDAVSSIISKNKKVYKKRARRTVNLFSGLTYCGCTGEEKMYVPYRTKNYKCTKCKLKIPCEDLEAVYKEQIKTFLLSPPELEKYLSQTDEIVAEKQQQIDGLTTELEKVKQEMETILELRVKGELPIKGFGKLYNPKEERAEQIENTLVELQTDLDNLKSTYMDKAKIQQEASSVYTDWIALDNEQKRTLVERLTRKIVVFPDEIQIDLDYVPASLEIPTKGQQTLQDS